MIDIIRIIIESVLGCSTLLGFILYYKANRRMKDAEASHKEAEAAKGKVEVALAEAEVERAEEENAKAEVSRLLLQVDHQQKTIENILSLNSSLSQRLSELNAAIDKHIDRNRELSDRLYKSETALNDANARIIKLTEERDEERVLKEHFKAWHCRNGACDIRIPPNKKLKTLKYEPPIRGVK